MKVTNTFGTFLVSLLSASAAAGAAVPVARSQGTIELKQTPNTKFSGKNGPLALARAYAKYGAPIPDDLAAIVQKIFDSNSLINNLKRDNGTGTATATPVSDDLEYLVEVAIGTPAQNLKLDFDTGSSDLWVFSSETPSGDKGSHSIYTPSQSSTSSAVQGATWSISYGDGSSSSGNVYKDDVSLGGLTVQGQDVELAQKVSSQFVSGQGDGLLGLAWDSINTVKPGPAKTWFDNIASSLDKPLFTADLKHQQPGSYTFGGIPSGAGTVNYAPVDNSQGFWQFSTTTSLGGGSITAIADTGTTLLLLSDDQVTAYYKGVAGAENNSQQGGYTFNCDATLPDFKFKVGSGEITVPGSLINYQTVSGNTCFGGLQSAGSIGFNIFGDIALKSSYVVFDQGNTQVGWAQKTQ